jgi:phosphoglycolate phosphatase
VAIILSAEKYGVKALVSAIVVFDLDGTLADSALQIAEATNSTRERFGLSAAKSKELSSWFGKHPSMFFSELDSVKKEEAISEFRKTLSETKNLIRPMSGAHKLLGYLRSVNVAMAVATTKPTWLAIEVLDELGMKNFFEIVQGSEALDPKPSNEVFVELEKKLASKPKYKFAIGDRVSDMKASISSRYDSTLLSSWGKELQDSDFDLRWAARYRRVSSLAEYQDKLRRVLSKLVEH